MATDVFYGSPYQRTLSAEETLPAKLDTILEQINLRDRVKDETVAIKMHLGFNIGYSVIHPVFVRKVVQAVKEGGGNPFVTDSPGSCFTAAERGYTTETLGCPIVPNQGVNEQYFYPKEKPYKNIKEWRVGGHLRDATFLVDLAHAKGHPSCAYGGIFKNIALGGMAAPTRGQMHDVMHHDQYWFPEKCPDAETRQKIIDACPFDCIVQDEENGDRLHIQFEPCNQCKRCLEVAPDGALKIDPVNFHSFQQAMAYAVESVLETFDKEKQVFINIGTQITPVCDCFGFTGPAILPDIGIFGGDDPCAVDVACLDMMKGKELILANVPESMEAQHDAGDHPLQQLHGPYKDPYLVCKMAEELGLGSCEYNLVNVEETDESGKSLADQQALSAT
jgi:hypothetical protein